MPLPTRVANDPVDIDPAVIAANDLTVDTFRAVMRERRHGMRSEDVGWVLHIPIDAPDIAGAMATATEIGRRITSRFPTADVGRTEISAADHQSVRHQVFCDAPIGQGGDCRLRPGHTTDHADQ